MISNFFIGLYDAEKKEISFLPNVESEVDRSQGHPGRSGLSGHIIRTRSPLFLPQGWMPGCEYRLKPATHRRHSRAYPALGQPTHRCHAAQASPSTMPTTNTMRSAWRSPARRASPSERTPVPGDGGRRSRRQYIAESALSASSVEELAGEIHKAVGRIAPAKNFYISLYDWDQDQMTFPYFQDEHDPIPPAQKLGTGLTSYVIRTGQPLLATPEVYGKLEKSGLAQGGASQGVDWLGIPLRASQEVRGVLAIQSYDPQVRLTEKHLEILTIIGAQAAGAIERLQARQDLANSGTAVPGPPPPGLLGVRFRQRSIHLQRPVLRLFIRLPSRRWVADACRPLRRKIRPPADWRWSAPRSESGGYCQSNHRPADHRIQYADGGIGYHGPIQTKRMPGPDDPFPRRKPGHHRA
jgi:hypothetical protein